jgi:hypothetical protein
MLLLDCSFQFSERHIVGFLFVQNVFSISYFKVGADCTEYCHSLNHFERFRDCFIGLGPLFVMLQCV